MSGLYDHIGPSIVAADLLLAVRRLRKHTGLDLVPMVVVEGPSDETLLGRMCAAGPQQVFAAGTRPLVEQLLEHLRREPIEGCTCVFITDCDGRGKTLRLKEEPALVVTENCDMEADLVMLGIVQEVLSAELNEEQKAASLIDEARALAVPVSRARRAADRVSVTFKCRGRRLSLSGIADDVLRSGRSDGLQSLDVLDAVQGTIGWTLGERERVEQELDATPDDFRQVCSGKDVVDAIWFLLCEDGLAGGLTVQAFDRHVRAGLQLRHLAGWEVGRRLDVWQRSEGIQLLRDAEPSESSTTS